MTTVELTIIKTNILAQLSNKDIAPLIISGPPGIGKSAAMKQITKELDYNLYSVSCPTFTSEKLSGLPSDYLATDLSSCSTLPGDVYGTRWSIPEAIADVNTLAKEKTTVFLLEDFHGMSPHLQSYFYELIARKETRCIPLSF